MLCRDLRLFVAIACQRHASEQNSSSEMRRLRSLSILGEVKVGSGTVETLSNRRSGHLRRVTHRRRVACCCKRAHPTHPPDRRSFDTTGPIPPSSDLSAQPEQSLPATSNDNWPWHVVVTLLVEAHGVAVSEPKDLRYFAGIDEVFGVHSWRHVGKCIRMFKLSH